MPEGLSAEWKNLVAWKTAMPTPVWPKRSAAWKPATVTLNETHLKRFFGFLILSREKGGLGADPGSLSLVHLSSPELLHAFLNWVYRYRGHYNAGDQAFLAFAAMLLHPETGWLSQQKGMVKSLAAIEPEFSCRQVTAARRNWSSWCKNALDYTRRALKDDELIQISRDPFDPIRPILESDEPIAALDMLFERVAAAIPMATGLNLTERARAYRDVILVGLEIETRLRRKNLSSLTYDPAGTGQLRREKDRYIIEIPWREFKNSNSPFFGPPKRKRNYVQELPA